MLKASCQVYHGLRSCQDVMQTRTVKVRPLAAFRAVRDGQILPTQRWEKILLVAVAILRVWCQREIPVYLYSVDRAEEQWLFL